MPTLRVVVVPRLGNKLARVDDEVVVVVDQGDVGLNLQLAREAITDAYGDRAPLYELVYPRV